MKVMVCVKASAESEAGAMPGEELMEAMTTMTTMSVQETLSQLESLGKREWCVGRADDE